ncbi:MAG: isoprenylcysteine carboxylmethyltransferase family protein, partial [Nitrospirota bacterium]
MAFSENLKKQGNWLFKRRSYFPLLILPILLIALQDSEYLKKVAGELADSIWEGFCVAISISGLAVRCITVGYVPEGTSGRNTRKQKAETLNTTGMYSIVRHPIYMGNFIIAVGLAMFVEVWWFTLIFILAFWLYYERIILAEEEFLLKKFGAKYSDWAKKTPTFLPKFKNWQKPNLPFSFRHVLNREHTTFFVIIASFTFMESTATLLSEGKLELDMAWAILSVIGLILYLTMRTLKKKTN